VNAVIPNRHSRHATTRGRAVCLLGVLACALLAARAQTNFLTYDPQGNLTNIAPAGAAAPTITGQPATQVISADGLLYFSVLADGAGPLAYQWFSNGVAIAGATSEVLAVTNIVVPTNLIANGGFETPVETAAYLTHAAGQNIGGWIVETGSVDHIYSAWQPAEGRQSLELNGTTQGAVRRDLPTTPGQQYYFHFALAGNPVSGPATKTNEVWWNGGPLDTNTFTTTGRTVTAMGWTNLEYLVTATSNTTRIRFASLLAGAYGPTVDHVTLFPVPPPAPQYTVVVSNSSGSVTSAVATVEFDSDGNGLPDAWERTWFGTLGFAAEADNDGDGVSNLDEFRDGTNPASSASFRPRMQLTATVGGAVALSPVQVSYALNQMAQLTAVPDAGWSFIGWFGGGINTNPVLNLTLSNSPSLLAVFGQTLVNGSNHFGSLTPNGTNFHALAANTGDTLILRCGKISGTASFAPQVLIYGPNGTLLDSAGNNTDAYVEYRTTNSGTFRVDVRSLYAGNSGEYRLSFARAPGVFVTPPGDEGGMLTNGALHAGTSELGDEDLWSFTANAGDQITLRAGRVSGSASYSVFLRLYGTNGALLATEAYANDTYLTYRTTNSGTFNVVVGSYYAGYTGSYDLHFARAPAAFIVPPGDEGGPLTNGGSYAGTNTIGDEDIWSFVANTGDQVVLRAGRTAGSASYTPYLRLYGTNGLLLASDAFANDTFLSYRTTNSGTFYAFVGSYYAGYTGEYQLHFAKAPGEFVVPPGDEGGPLVNGGAHDGTTAIGDEDIWSVTGNNGDTVVLRCAKLSGTASYAPWVRFYGTGGVLLDSDQNATDTYVTYRLTNSGTFNVLVGSYNAGHTGTYRLRLAKAPGSYIVPPGDEGGLLLTGSTNDSVTELADEDLWTLTAFKNVPLSLTCQELTGTVSYAPWIRLYGVNGVLLSSAVNASLATINYTPTYSGTFTLLVGSANVGHTGTYRLTGTGYSEGLNVVPNIVGTNILFTGSGGGSNAQFILMMTTNLAQPVTLWTPVRTNTFNGSGAFNVTNFYDLNLPRQFFQLLVP
jgi:choice-of-anchor C domain-containing protein